MKATQRQRPFAVAATLAVTLPIAAAIVGCTKETPAEPEAPKKDQGGGGIPPAASNATLSSGLSTSPTKPSSGDPWNGSFTLADATKNIGGSGALLATLDTGSGKITCKLYEDKAPNTVANFVGLATGERTWKSPAGQWVNTPAYDNTVIHRVIKGYIIQGGDPKGNGTGEPGYVIADEVWSGAKHDRAGLLCMANRGPNTNGAQWFITDGPANQLDGGYTIFGECTPLGTIHEIASAPVVGDRPVDPVKLKTVSIAREKPGPAKKGADSGARDAAK